MTTSRTTRRQTCRSWPSACPTSTTTPTPVGARPAPGGGVGLPPCLGLGVVRAGHAGLSPAPCGVGGPGLWGADPVTLPPVPGKKKKKTRGDHFKLRFRKNFQALLEEQVPPPAPMPPWPLTPAPEHKLCRPDPVPCSQDLGTHEGPGCVWA